MQFGLEKIRKAVARCQGPVENRRSGAEIYGLWGPLRMPSFGVGGIGRDCQHIRHATKRNFTDKTNFLHSCAHCFCNGSFVLLCIHFAGVVGRAWARKARHARRISVKSG